MTVYVLTWQEDGDTQVLGVFSSAGKAMRAGMVFAECEVEWEPGDADPGLLWEVTLGTEDDPEYTLTVEAFELDDDTGNAE